MPPGFDGWRGKCSKTSLRSWYPNTERIIFAEHAAFGEILKNARIKAGITTIQLAHMIGAFGNINHGGAVSNWERNLNIPTLSQFKKLASILQLPDYSSIIRPFAVNKGVQYTDIWKFKTVKPYKGKHPCEKPIELLRHIINASSREGDLILDCFCGSGNTLKAAGLLGRQYLGIEISPHWAEVASSALKEMERKQDGNILLCNQSR